MSRNDEWCRSLGEWRQAIGRWVRRGHPRDLLNIDIFFDFEPVYGSAALAGQLQTALCGRATRRSDFLKLLARNASPDMPADGRFSAGCGPRMAAST